jgi:Family of unknown function (DUF6152)
MQEFGGSVKNKFLTALLGLFAVSGPLFAHHGSAAYDTTKKVVVKATVTQWFWANPHCFLKFDVKDEQGNVVHWVAEASNPPDLVQLGWSQNTVKPGDEVTVNLMPAKNGQPIGRLQTVTLADGHVFKSWPTTP